MSASPAEADTEKEDDARPISPAPLEEGSPIPKTLWEDLAVQPDPDSTPEKICTDEPQSEEEMGTDEESSRKRLLSTSSSASKKSSQDAKQEKTKFRKSKIPKLV